MTMIQMGLGFVFYEADYSQQPPTILPNVEFLFHAGEESRDDKPRYLKEPVTILGEWHLNLAIGSPKDYKILDFKNISFEDIFGHSSARKWYFGLSLDRSQQVTFWAKNEEGEIKQKALGKIFTSPLIIVS